MFVSMTLLSIWRTKGTSTAPRFFYISTLRRNGRKTMGSVYTNSRAGKLIMLSLRSNPWTNVSVSVAAASAVYANVHFRPPPCVCVSACRVSKHLSLFAESKGILAPTCSCSSTSRPTSQPRLGVRQLSSRAPFCRSSVSHGSLYSKSDPWMCSKRFGSTAPLSFVVEKRRTFGVAISFWRKQT